VTLQTPIYGIEYLAVGEPARTTRQVMENNAHTIEAALTRGGIVPPEAADLILLTARVTALEAAWQNYTPTLGGITVGNGSIAGRYLKRGRTVDFSVLLTAGSTSAVTGLVTIGLPAAAHNSGLVVGAGYRHSPSGAVVWRGNSPTTIYVYDSANGSVWQSGTSFAAGASLRLSGTYEAAA
jgi:hypothetical protein